MNKFEQKKSEKNGKLYQTLNIWFDCFNLFECTQKMVQNQIHTIFGYHQTKLIQIDCYHHISFHAVEVFGQGNWALMNYVLLFIK